MFRFAQPVKVKLKILELKAIFQVSPEEALLYLLGNPPGNPGSIGHFEFLYPGPKMAIKCLTPGGHYYAIKCPPIARTNLTKNE